MSENPTFFFDNLSDDILDKESPTNFFDTDSQRSQLQLLLQFVSKNGSDPYSLQVRQALVKQD